MSLKILAINLPNLDLSYYTLRGLKLDITHIESNQNFPPRYAFTNSQGINFYTPDITQYLEQRYPKYEFSFVLYGYINDSDAFKSTGGYTSPFALKSGTYWASVRKDGNENAYAVHEMGHLLCEYINLTLKDFTPKDFMDITPVNGQWIPYYLNNFPNDPNSNHSQTWKNIEKFLPQLNNIKYGEEEKTVILKRAYATTKQQLGDLITDGFACKTMERSYINNQRNISAIPKGEYQVVWSFSYKFMKYTYEILDVPNRSGIRIHPANLYSQLQGCIALGSHYFDLNKDDQADIANSTKTLRKFEDFMGRKPFKLVII